MRAAKATTRLLAIFVVAFLCLNVGAFACLAYCEIRSTSAATHCPLQKAGAAHCPLSQLAAKQDHNANDSIAGSAMTCCMMPVGVLGVPLEAKAGTITAMPLTAAVEKAEFAPVVFTPSRQISKFYYRPPPNDARIERVRNQVFRI